MNYICPFEWETSGNHVMMSTWQHLSTNPTSGIFDTSVIAREWGKSIVLERVWEASICVYLKPARIYLKMLSLIYIYIYSKPAMVVRTPVMHLNLWWYSGHCMSCRGANRLTTQTNKQTNNKNQSNKQTNKQPTNQPTNQSINQTNKQTTNQTNKQTTNQPINQ